MVKQDKINKLSPNFGVEPFNVVKQCGSKVTVENKGSTFTRHKTFIKKFITNEEQEEEKSEPVQDQEAYENNADVPRLKRKVKLPEKFNDFVM